MLHVCQRVKPDVASRDAGRDTVDIYGREVGPPKKAVYDTVVVRRVFGPAEAALQLRSKGRGSHDLRRTRATLLIAAEAHAKLVQEGPRAPAHHTLNLYGHMLPSTEAALVDALDAIYEQCDEGDDAAAVQES